MARCLIIGCGCRGLRLAGVLRQTGHAVRGTTRDPERLAALQSAGVEGFLGDPDRVATLAPAFAQVGVLCVLLGSAVGPAEQLQALHGTRLEMLLAKMLDTTARGVVYECAGSVDAELLAAGAARVRRACQRSLIPHRFLAADPRAHSDWLAAATAAVAGVLAS